MAADRAEVDAFAAVDGESPDNGGGYADSGPADTSGVAFDAAADPLADATAGMSALPQPDGLRDGTPDMAPVMAPGIEDGTPPGSPPAAGSLGVLPDPLADAEAVLEADQGPAHEPAPDTETSTAVPPATQVDAWWTATLPICRTLADRAGEVGLANSQDILDIVVQGVKHGMRPARSLTVAGILDGESVWSLAAPPEPETVPEPVPEPPASARPPVAAQQVPLRFGDVDMKTARMVPLGTISRLSLLPVREDDSNVYVASVVPEPHPVSWNEIAKAIRGASGLNAVLEQYDPQTVANCIEQVKLELGAEDDVHQDATDEEITQRALQNYESLTAATATAAGAQSGQLLARLLLDAVGKNASDIHVFGTRNENGVQCYQARLRVDGTLNPFSHADGSVLEVPTAVGKAIVARVIAVGLMDENSRKPRSGRFEIAFPEDPAKQYDLRVEIIPQHGEGFLIVIRLLSTADKPLSIDTIYPGEESSLAADARDVLEDMRSGGLFMVCGATGSGKTTFLAGAMSYLNDPRKHLLTIEHPIEKRINGVRQIQVDPSTPGMGFVPAIESAMRLDPDIIMIGELRSRETAETAIQAAETGHMVLTTMHTNSAAATPARFKHLGISGGDLSNVLHGVLAQSLVAVRCDKCVRQNLPAEGCAYCEGSGWKGRAAVGEIMKITPEVRSLIARDASPTELEEASGHRLKAMHAGQLIASGKTTRDEVADKLGATAAMLAAEEAAAAATATATAAKPDAAGGKWAL